MQGLIFSVVEKRNLFVGDRREVDLHRAVEAGMKIFRPPGRRLDDFDDLDRRRQCQSRARIGRHLRTAHRPNFPYFYEYPSMSALSHN